MHRSADNLDVVDGAKADHDIPITPLSHSVPEAARICGVSARRMWDKVRREQIASYIDEGRRLITHEACVAYVAARVAESKQAA